MPNKKTTKTKHDLGKIIHKSGLSQKDVSELLEWKESQLSAYVNHEAPIWINEILNENEETPLETFEAKKAKAQKDIIYYDKMIKRVKNIVKIRDNAF